MYKCSLWISCTDENVEKLNKLNCDISLDNPITEIKLPLIPSKGDIINVCNVDSLKNIDYLRVVNFEYCLYDDCELLGIEFEVNIDLDIID